MVSSARHSLAALFAALLSICLCLAAPGLAHADAAGSPATAGDSGAAGTSAAGTSATDATDTEGAGDLAAYSLGGVQIGLPADGLQIVTLGGIALVSNEDASLVVTIIPATGANDLPTSQEELYDYFGDLAQAAAEEVGVSVSAGYLYTMSDGEHAYLYLLEYEESGVSVQAGMCFVPISATDYTLVQITFDSTNREVAELANSISATIALATPEATPLDSVVDGVALTQKIEAGGLTFGLPEDFALDKDSTDDEPSWYNEKGTVMLSVMPGLVNGISTVSAEAFDLIAEGIAQNLEGSIEGTTIIENDGAKVYTYMFTFSTADVEFVGALGMVTLADDTVTGILALAPIEEAETIDATAAAVFDSVRLA